MKNQSTYSVQDWIVELDSADTQRRQRALDVLAVLAPSNSAAAAALRAAGVTDRHALGARPGGGLERSHARRLYGVSLLLPVVAVAGVCLGPALALYPLLLLGLVIVGLRSGARFVFWHTNQWLLLTVPFGVLVAGLYLTDYLSEVGWVLLLGLLWYLGNIVGFRQAGAGECWLWRLTDSHAALPRPWADDRPAPAEVAPPAVQFHPAAHWLRLFRTGTAAERQDALTALEVLGEVEVF